MQLEEINCIICESKDCTNYISIVDQYNKLQNIVQCNCGFVYLNPRPTKISIKKYYDSEYFSYQGKKHSIFIRTFQKLNLHWKKSLINKYKKNGKIIDIGSGDNNFKKYMKKIGWQCYSYEPYNDIETDYSKDTIANCKDSFDVITLWHSLEHMHDIDDILNNIKNILSNNGYLIIALPNYKSIDSSLFNKNWVAYDVPRHLYHFTEDSLLKLLIKFDLKIIKSHRMIQDSFFNISLSLKKTSLIKLFLLWPIYIVYSLIIIFFNKHKSSSLVYICQKK